jgi:hypothetical protein
MRRGIEGGRELVFEGRSGSSADDEVRFNVEGLEALQNGYGERRAGRAGHGNHKAFSSAGGAEVPFRREVNKVDVVGLASRRPWWCCCCCCEDRDDEARP